MNREEISGLGDKDNDDTEFDVGRYAASYDMARMLLDIHAIIDRYESVGRGDDPRRASYEIHQNIKRILGRDE